MSDAQTQIFAAARANRKIAAHLARDMFKQATTAPQFKPGLGAAMRKASELPQDAAKVLADLFAAHGVASDAKALRDLADACGLHRLTWADVDGN